ncbi:MAG: hypothetical protein O3B37_01515 [Proteobacteria bacterium]|nr:hypothetical protein [Pseudomonadota bacterium]
MSDQKTGYSAARLLYFDVQAASCMRAIDAAADLGLSIQTVSHSVALHDACGQFKPSAVLAVLRPEERQALHVIGVISDARPQIPILIAGDVDISRDGTLGARVKSLGLDARGSVRVGGSLRDLQLALLCAIAGLGGGPTA